MNDTKQSCEQCIHHAVCKARIAIQAYFRGEFTDILKSVKGHERGFVQLKDIIETNYHNTIQGLSGYCVYFDEVQE